MAPASPADVKFEIGHVLFIDIVGYSKLLINEQSERLQKLREIVRGAEQFRTAEAEGKLLRLPAGDGGALVFRTSSEAPVLCALEISRELKKHPELRVRMGIHSGPVNEITDLNEQANIAGAGINIAQRVMDCGEAGHILLSRHVAEDLEHYPRWRTYLHELGECEVKHGARLSVVNLYTEELGNPGVPEKLKAARAAAAAAAATKRKRTTFRRISVGAVALLVAIAAIGFPFFRYASRFAATALAVPEKSIAVLPFENLSEEKQSAYFADGVQDEVLSDLAKVADLKVISRTSVMLYKAGNPRNLREIGQQLGVAHILEGSVQRAGGKVRVNAQLIDARTDKHLWAQTYDRDLADVFAIQSEIAQKIADQLKAKISPGEKAAIEEQPTKDLAAYDLYVRAKALIDKAGEEEGEEQAKDYFQAVDLLDQAIARDPGFLLAYCRLAEAHDALYFFEAHDHTPKRLALAKSAIDTAFRLKPDSAEAHVALALHLYWGYLDYDHARDELAIAARTLPNNAQVFELSGFIDRRQGRWPDAIRNLERASELDPRGRAAANLEETYRVTRAYKQARALIDRRPVFDPGDENIHQLFRAAIDLEERADTRPSHAAIEKILRDDPASSRGSAIPRLILAFYDRDSVAADRALAEMSDETFFVFIKEPNLFTKACVQGLMARAKGDEAAARAAFSAARAEQEKAVEARPPDQGARFLSVLGLIDAALGRKEEALREARQAIELTPVAKNAIDGAGVLYCFAVICAWTGERDLATEQLKTLVAIPCGASYGDLRLDPSWDPLRGDPRFEKIVQSLAPK